MKKKILPLLTLLFISCVAIIAEGAEDEWIETGSMNVERAYHTATVLSNGKVLVVGGMLPPPPVVA